MSCKAYFPVYVNTPVLVSRCVPCKVTKSDDDDVRGHTALPGRGAANVTCM